MTRRKARPRHRRWRAGFRWLFCLRVNLATALLLLVAFSQLDRLFTALVLATIFIYFLIGLSFYSAIAANLIALAAYVQGARMAIVPPAELVYNVAMLVFANLVGAAMAYNVEHTRRKSWLESKLLAELADRDGLTGIANRRRFDEHLARLWHQAAREHRPLALLLADLDFFKAYNDRYGHQAGDEAMKQVATVLSRAARRPLELAARYGGEEFAVMLYDATQDHAARVAEQIMQAVRRLGIPHAGSTCAPVLTTSVGVACVVPMAKRSTRPRTAGATSRGCFRPNTSTCRRAISGGTRPRPGRRSPVSRSRSRDGRANRARRGTCPPY